MEVAERGVSPTQIMRMDSAGAGRTGPGLSETKTHHLKELIEVIEIGSARKNSRRLRSRTSHPAVGHDQPNWRLVNQT